uniref:Uncharacterized protein n=1 Tax=Arundo donax TaxID=35708 RepID=A0A0A9B259_ARUDO
MLSEHILKKRTDPVLEAPTHDRFWGRETETSLSLAFCKEVASNPVSWHMVESTSPVREACPSIRTYLSNIKK